MRILLFGNGSLLDLKFIAALLKKNFFVCYKNINVDCNLPVDRFKENSGFKFFDKLALKSCSLQSAFAEFDIDGVLNISGLFYPLECDLHRRYFFSQIELAELLIESIAGYNKKKIRYLSSFGYEIFGSIESGFFNEESKVNPSCLINSYKANVYLTSRAMAISLGIEFNFIFSSSIYGTELEGIDLLNVFAVRLSEKKAIKIMGDGAYIRNWIFIDDLIDGTALIMQKGCAYELYCLGGDQDRLNSCVDIAYKMCDYFNSFGDNGSFDYRSLVKFSGGHVFDERRAISSYKSRCDVGYESIVLIEEGIRVISDLVA